MGVVHASDGSATEDLGHCHNSVDVAVLRDPDNIVLLLMTSFLTLIIVAKTILVIIINVIRFTFAKIFLRFFVLGQIEQNSF